MIRKHSSLSPLFRAVAMLAMWLLVVFPIQSQEMETVTVLGLTPVRSGDVGARDFRDAPRALWAGVKVYFCTG